MISVIVTTFSWPDALGSVLRALADQEDSDFEVVVADDGSGPKTRTVVDAWHDAFEERLTHVWQPDLGFRLARVRNLGALAASGDHFVFIDGDCIPRRGFVKAIRRALVPGWFLAGKRVQLSEDLSDDVLTRELAIGCWGSARLLLRCGRGVRPWVHLLPRDRRRPWRPDLPDFFPDSNAYGFMTAVARSDFEAVNGFDLRFVGWGDQDVDLAIRLRRSGLRCGYAGSNATLFHLAHPTRVPKERPTWLLLEETRRSHRTHAVDGVRELARSQGRPAPAARLPRLDTSHHGR